MKSHDEYYTVEGTPRTELKVNSSKFIASAKSVANKEEANSFLESIRSEFHDATHNCFAWRFGLDGLESRSSDDGEPSGTAGKPILFALHKAELSDIIVVVTRYFGGKKLGKGPLARAYSDAANEVLAGCTRRKVLVTIAVKVFCIYEDLSNVIKIIEEFGASFTQNFSDAVEILVNLPSSEFENFSQKIISATKGRAGAILG
ncbi:MAG: hypothetical protein HW421_2210 [Ignavibacteria bacterium]|nr:hypothetical protein [Ignavibacteria bacterium]